MQINVIRFRYGSAKDPILVKEGELFDSYVVEAVDETTGKTIFNAYVKRSRNNIGWLVGKDGGCFTTYGEAEKSAIELLPIREAEYKAEVEEYNAQARKLLGEE